MKSLKYLSSVLWSITLISSFSCCAKKSVSDQPGFATIHGTVDSILDNQKVYIINPFNDEIEDSTEVKDCNFDFGQLQTSGDSTALRLLAAYYPFYDTRVRVALPVYIDNSDIKAHLGSSLGVTGSAMNNRITDFLVDLNDMSAKAKDMPIDDFRQVFVLYISQKIGENHDNSFGRYLFETYRSRLDSASLEDLHSRYGF